MRIQINQCLLVALMIATAGSSAMADKVCLKTTVNKKTFKVTTQSAVAANCAQGWTELLNTSTLRGTTGDAGAKGDTGPKGETGSKGDAGASGPLLGPEESSSLRTIDVGPLACPNSGILELYTVPVGRSYIVTQFFGAGTNVPYSQIGEVLNDSTIWKIDAELFYPSNVRFSYKSTQGVVFRSGSKVVVTCAAANNLYYHVDGFLVADSVPIGQGGGRGPRLPQDIKTLDPATPSTCPNSGLISIFTVPYDKTFVLREVTVRGTNAGYTTVGESTSGSIDWKITGEVFNSGDNYFKHSAPLGITFSGGSEIVLGCSAGSSNLKYHVDGYLTDPS